MIIENTGLTGLQSDLHHLDEITSGLGFVRWQWEYYRATYDLKLVDKNTKEEYFVRVNTRAVSGKLESPDTVLALEEAYVGRATFPHGLEYESPVPQNILQTAKNTLSELKKKLSE